MNLRAKITMMIFLAVLVPLCLTGSYIYLTQNVDPREGMARLLVTTGEATATLMDNFIVQRGTEIGLVSGSSTLRGTAEEAQYGLERYHSTFDEFDSLVFTDPAGNLVAKDGKVLLSKGENSAAAAARRWVKKAEQGTRIIDVVAEPGNFDRYLVFVAPVQHQGRDYGWIFGQLNSEKIAAFSNKVKVGKTGRATLFNGDGILIGHPNKSRYGYDMSNYSIMADTLQRGVNNPGDFFRSGDGRDKWGMTLLLEDTLEKYDLKWGLIVDQTVKEMFAPNRRLRNALILITVFCLAVFPPLGFWLVNRYVSRPLGEVISGLEQETESIVHASGQLSAGSSELADASSTQAASLEETSSSLEEISAMTKQNAESSDRAEGLVREVNGVIGRAGESMQQLTTSMAEINQASEDTSKIIKTIDEIAFQTNLLALNAAVEAARAGEAGAGFAVVADEVRNLALRSAEAARSTAELIDDTVAKVHSGTKLVNQTDTAFSEVSDSSGKITMLMNEIATASREQATGIEQLNKAVAEMESVVQRTAANSEESAASAQEMDGLSNDLEDYVRRLKAMVG
ncbi:MAG: methyl-accepting chemotaxis protein [Desulfurivibrio sp.]|nr:methyl-accepting chemotaxis protein [Desulfurivibrio sp.]